MTEAEWREFERWRGGIQVAIESIQATLSKAETERGEIYGKISAIETGMAATTFCPEHRGCMEDVATLKTQQAELEKRRLALPKWVNMAIGAAAVVVAILGIVVTIWVARG